MEEPLWGAGIFGTRPEKDDFSGQPCSAMLIYVKTGSELEHTGLVSKNILLGGRKAPGFRTPAGLSPTASSP